MRSSTGFKFSELRAWHMGVMFIATGVLPFALAIELFLVFCVLAALAETYCDSVRAAIFASIEQFCREKGTCSCKPGDDCSEVAKQTLRYSRLCEITESFNRKFGFVLVAVFAGNVLMASSPAARFATMSVVSRDPVDVVDDACALVAAIVYNFVLWSPFVRTHEVVSAIAY